MLWHGAERGKKALALHHEGRTEEKEGKLNMSNKSSNL